MIPGVDQVMHLWQGCHRCDIVLFSLCPFSWHAVLKCSVTDDVHSDHLIKVMSVSHLHCEVFGRGWGTLRRRQWHPTPALLPGKSHGRKSLVGCSPWDRYKLDTTEWLHFHFSLSGIGEGNGNPLQCSCLENPRDWGAWWAAVYGVAQSRTWLKRLSSCSSRGTLTSEKFEKFSSSSKCQFLHALIISVWTPGFLLYSNYNES